MSRRKVPLRAAAHAWEFQARFRRHAFGWKSQPAIARVRQAVAEIEKVAKKEPLLAAEGAVLFLERLSPALERIDSSSGSIGTAVGNAIARLVPVIADAPADAQPREAWLERLFAAQEADQIPYIEQIADHWGELCASKEVASAWAERLLGRTRLALSPDGKGRAHYHGISACLSALYRAERYGELIDVLRIDTIWQYKQWAVRALAASGQRDEAIRYAESCRGPRSSDHEVDPLCEEILLSAGMHDEAYSCYGLRANSGGTYLATFRRIAQKYPHKVTREILADLARTTPGDEGKWFAAAVDAGHHDEALALATRGPCDPQTLTRAARGQAEEHPTFAVGAGLLALHWLAQGYGYDITSAHVREAYRATLAAAERLGNAAEVKERVRQLIAADGPGGRFLVKMLDGELEG